MSSESGRGPGPGLSARARAGRSNGARSRGPNTAAGTARSSRNALKHGLCAQKILVLPDEDAAAFKTLEAALLAELAPVGALQAVLARRVVSAAWRLARADRTEAEVLAFRRGRDGDLGLALVRDGNGTRSVEALMRYRNAALAELLRTLRTLQTLQAEARADAGVPAAVRKRRLLRRNEPTKARQINGLTDKLPAEPPAAPDRQSAVRRAPPPIARSTAMLCCSAPAPTMKPTREHTPAQPLAPRAPHEAHQRTPDHKRPDTAPAMPTSAPARTKPTRETTPKQAVGVRTKRASAL